MNRRRAGSLLALTVVAASACGYHVPRPAVRIGMNSFAADVLYGSAAAAVLPGAVALPPAPIQPGVTAGQPATAVSTANAPSSVAKTVASCPAPRSAVVEQPTVNRVTVAPVAATYPFRANQKITSSTRDNSLTNITETRQVTGVTTSGATIDFTVTSHYPFTGVVETTGYQIVTSSDAPSTAEGEVPAGTLSGVYVTKQTVSEFGATSSVTWSPPLQVLKLPAAPGETWAVSSTDRNSGLAETLTATIDAVSEVNACGALVQGYEVHLTGSLVSPGQVFPLSVDETQLIAPQFGGLVLADNATITSRTSPTATQTQQVADTINVTPKLPPGGAR